MLVLPKARHDWVQQLSDFYIVRVPEGKTFAHEALDMPVLFIMGQHSTVQAVEIKGFINFVGSDFRFQNSLVDGSRMVTDIARPLVSLKECGNIFVSDCHFISGPGNTACIQT